jgi:hypothetical protein
MRTFGELFEEIGRRLEYQKCDSRSLRIVGEIAVEHRLDADLIVPFIEEHGGHCDCEALENAAEQIDASKLLPALA